MISIQLYQSWRNKWNTFDPVPLSTVSEMGIHLSITILDCGGITKDSAERAWSSDRCASSGGSVSKMMEQKYATRWQNIMEQHCCCHNGIAILIFKSCSCTDLHIEGGMLSHLHVEGMSTKGNVNRNLSHICPNGTFELMRKQGFLNVSLSEVISAGWWPLI